MGERWERFAGEVGRFLAVGLLATIVALILFNFLVHGFNTANFALLNDQPELAYLIANLVGMAISFRFTKGWAFRERQTNHPDGGVLAFIAINFATMLIPMACLWVSRNVARGGRPDLGQHLRQRPRPAARQHGEVLPVPRAGLPASRPVHAGHRSVHDRPSSAVSSRTSGRLRPTTLWWSPSIPVTNAPPIPSTVKAPATASGSPVAT